MTLTDFNDLHVTQGIDAVRQQLFDAAFQQPKAEQNPSQAHPVMGEKIAVNNNSFGRYSHSEIMANFALIYGTDCVWDYKERKQMKIGALNHLLGKDAFKDWKESPIRKIIKGLVFEPSGNVSPEEVNLFTGFPLTPSPLGARGCEKILDHVFNLCQQREAEFRWLLNWIAYPLQKRGAKMDTSIVIYGEEGTGKSFLWEKIIGKIYGEYAITVGQSQLESQFNTWQSSKLFVLCEEVVSKQERSQHKGRLKHLITGKTVLINEKSLPERQENNYANVAFLSNSTIPLELDTGDRRYLVLYCDIVPNSDYFKELFNEVNNGGVEAFYQYLLELDLTKFDEHTKPPVNEDKKNLINVSLPSPLLFVNEWKDGFLDIPYCSCTSSDLFNEYIRWCERNNEFKKRNRDFVAEVRRVLVYSRHDLMLNSMSRRTQRVFVSEDDYKHCLDKDYVKRIDESCMRFKDAIATRRNPNGD